MTTHVLAVHVAADKKAPPAAIRAAPGAGTRTDLHAAPSPTHYGHADTIAVSQDLPRAVDLIPASADRIVSFGPFHLLLTRRLLLEGEKPLRLGSRALDILIALVERPGKLVSKEELMARVWPNTFVEPANLTVHVAALRRALGDGHDRNRYLVNIPGRGYCFVAPVKVSEKSKSSPPHATERRNNLPASITGLMGRAETVNALTARMSGQRLLTIVGSGGIGKTSVALAVAEGLIPNYEHGVWFIDLSPLDDPLLVSSTLACALGLDIGSQNPLSDLIAVLQDKQMLLVLDNCEHVIEAAAAFVAEILRSAPGVRILATGREPLRVQGEGVHRLSSLQSPPTSAKLSASEALSFPSVQLFVESAAEAMNEFVLSDEDAPIVAEICSELDGNPLAIKFAAAGVARFGIPRIATLLADRWRLLVSRCRNTPARHQSMSATLDWSYQLLSEPEQLLLRRLAAFAGDFTVGAASAVAASEIEGPDVLICMANLLDKSLVVTSLSGSIMCYRLPQTTRAYALQKLTESGEVQQVRETIKQAERSADDQVNSRAQNKRRILRRDGPVQRQVGNRATA
jgi:predicted ATPase/DNA-binding winged helix-turn-helix (wHTH) protein